jgi:hypothetical protein
MWCAFSRWKKVFSLSISVVSKNAANVWGSKIAGFSDQLYMLVGSMQREPFMVPVLFCLFLKLWSIIDRCSHLLVLGVWNCFLFSELLFFGVSSLCVHCVGGPPCKCMFGILNDVTVTQTLWLCVICLVLTGQFLWLCSYEDWCSLGFRTKQQHTGLQFSLREWWWQRKLHQSHWARSLAAASGSRSAKASSSWRGLPVLCTLSLFWKWSS